MFATAKTKSKCAALRTFGTESQQLAASLLYDDDVQVIATFDMNRIASLTYGDAVRGEIFEMIRETVSQPIDYTVPTLHKTLCLLKHLVIYGSERTVNEAWALGTYVNNLRDYNTVLMAYQSQNTNSAAAAAAAGVGVPPPGNFWLRIKGGDVDRGAPVREAAEDLHLLLSSADRIRSERNRCADPNSLVPVGTNRDVAYATDDVRLRMLRMEMDRASGRMVKSNLKKDTDGFGSGFNSATGGTVVGAAHGIDEMLAMAKREKKRFTDDPTSSSAGRGDEYVPTREELEELQRSLKAAYGGGGGSKSTSGAVADRGKGGGGGGGGGDSGMDVPDLLGMTTDSSATAESEKRRPFRQNPDKDPVDDILGLVGYGGGGGGRVSLAPPAARSGRAMPATPYNSVRLPSGSSFVSSSAPAGAGVFDLLGGGGGGENGGSSVAAEVDLLGATGGELDLLGMGSGSGPAGRTGDGNGAVDDDLLSSTFGGLSIASRSPMRHQQQPSAAVHDPFAPVALTGDSTAGTSAPAAAAASSDGSRPRRTVMGSLFGKALSVFDDLVPETDAVKKYGVESNAAAAMDRLMSGSNPAVAPAPAAAPPLPPPTTTVTATGAAGMGGSAISEPHGMPPPPTTSPPPPPDVPPPMVPLEVPSAPLRPDAPSPPMSPPPPPPYPCAPFMELPKLPPPELASEEILPETSGPLSLPGGGGADDHEDGLVPPEFDPSNIMGGVAPPPFAPPPPPPPPPTPVLAPSLGEAHGGAPPIRAPPPIDSIGRGGGGNSAGNVIGGGSFGTHAGAAMGGMPGLALDPLALQGMMASMTPEQKQQMMQQMMAMNQQLMMMMNGMGNGGGVGGGQGQ